MDGCVYRIQRKWCQNKNKEGKFELQIWSFRGNLKEKIKVSVVDANIPLILDTEYQKKWGMRIVARRQEIYIKKKSVDRFKKDKETNHWTLPIKRKKRRKEEEQNLTYTMNLKTAQDWQLRQCEKKIHKKPCYKSKEQLTKIILLDGKHANTQSMMESSSV